MYIYIYLSTFVIIGACVNLCYQINLMMMMVVVF